MDVNAFPLAIIPEYPVRIGPFGLDVGFKHLLTAGTGPGIVLLAVEAIVFGVSAEIFERFSRCLVLGGA